MVRAVVLVKSPRTLTASQIQRVEGVKEVFNVAGRFDAVAYVEVASLADLKKTALGIQKVAGVRRTETLVELS